MARVLEFHQTSVAKRWSPAPSKSSKFCEDGRRHGSPVNTGRHVNVTSDLSPARAPAAVKRLFMKVDASADRASVLMYKVLRFPPVGLAPCPVWTAPTGGSSVGTPWQQRGQKAREGELLT